MMAYIANLKHKGLLLLALFLLFAGYVKTQPVTIYNEDFGFGFGGWTESELTNPWASGDFMQTFWNEWMVNDEESGMPPDECGAANMGNPSLHMGAVGFGDIGAAYVSDAPTNKRISSPAISTVGYTDLVLSFNFIGNGCEDRDKAYLQYSIDGGATWASPTGAPTTSNPALPPGAGLDNLKSDNAGCLGQGRWTNITWEMPAECEDIADLRIAFVWQNNDNEECGSTPEDPSFAVDDIIITALEEEEEDPEEPEDPVELDVSLNVNHANCGFYGSAHLTIIESCTGNPSVEWSTGHTGFHLENLEPGNYDVTISDGAECEDAIIAFTINDENFINVTITYDGNPCNEPITAHANILGADPEEVDLTWSTQPPQFSESVYLEYSGNYIATVNYGTCTDTDSITVIIDGFYYELEYDEILCQGDTNVVSINIIQGNGPFYQVWSTGQSVPSITITEPGEYYVEVTDSLLDCSYIQDFEIIMSPFIHVNVNKEDISCNGLSDGHIMLNVQGGVPPYTYLWDNGLMTSDQMNIPAGSYTLTITDSYNCEDINNFVITEPAPLSLSSFTVDNDCYGDESGLILLNVVGGTSPYTYLWSNDETTQNLEELSGGSYSVSVYDDNDCSAFTMIDIYEPEAPLTLALNKTDVRCFGEGNGSIDLEISGGTEPYFVQWSTGASTQNIDELIPGFYTVTVTDSNDCEAIDSVQIRQPSAPLSGTISGTHNNCYGDANGTISITVTGGWPYEHPEYDYLFDWSNDSWQQNQTSLTAGTYYVTVSDSIGCHYYMEFEVTQPDELIVVPIDDPTICYGQIAEIGIAVLDGGVSPYSISWDNEGHGMSTFVQPTETTSYGVTVTDANSCEVDYKKVTVYVHDELEMTVFADEDTVCQGEIVIVEVSITGGGVSPNSVFVNDSLMSIPVSLVADQDSVYQFFIEDACGFDNVSETVVLNTHPAPPISVSTNRNFGCVPLRIEFSENTQEFGRKYVWDFDDGEFENLSFSKNPIHTFNNPTTYYVNLMVTSEDNCKADTTLAIVAYPLPIVDFMPSQTNVSLLSPVVHFTNYTEGGYFYDWDFGDGGTSSNPQPSYTYFEAGDFTVSLTATSLYGCADSTKLNIRVTDETAVWAPTAFTPNQDDLNETFKVFLGGIDTEEMGEYELVIYNRWGNPVFISEDYQEEWDGTFQDMLCEPGLYMWILKFTDNFGNTRTKNGQLTLIR